MTYRVQCPGCGGMIFFDINIARLQLVHQEVPQSFSIQNYIDAVARAMGTTPEMLTGQRKNTWLVRRRWAVWNALVHKRGLARIEVGRMFNRDHSTVISGLRGGEDLIDKEDPEYIVLRDLAWAMCPELPAWANMADIIKPV